MLFQDDKIHSATSNVVNNKKSKEIPSKPMVKYTLYKGIKGNLLINWNLTVDLSKNIHRMTKPINARQLKSNAISFCNLVSFEFMKSKVTIPIIGSSKFKINKFGNILSYKTWTCMTASETVAKDMYFICSICFL